MIECILFMFSLGIIYSSKFSSALISAIGFSIIGFIAVDWLIPSVSQSFVKAGLFGKDLSKPGKPIIPETIGIITSTVYLFVMFFYIPFMFYKYLVITSGGGHRDMSVIQYSNDGLFPHGKLIEYLSAMLCLESTLLLGIADDLFDLRWRHKLFIPAIAAIPLFIVYYIDFGVTYVLIPPFIQNLLNLKKTTVDLGWAYYIYMGAFAIFCPNSINILAGVNGLEVGQSILIGITFLINDVLYLTIGPEPARESHMFSAILIIPFIGVSLALWKWNRWPARVFVGDTYCYFSGMLFAVIGILGHFSKTTLLFFLPQIFNFIYSSPQLFHFVPCPRHRLPKFQELDGLMYVSLTDLSNKPLNPFIETILKILYRFNLIHLNMDKKGKLESCSNMTLINLCLVWFGPMREDQLCKTVLGLQFISGLLGIVARHFIGSLIFGHDNLFCVI